MAILFIFINPPGAAKTRIKESYDHSLNLELFPEVDYEAENYEAVIEIDSYYDDNCNN